MQRSLALVIAAVTLVTLSLSAGPARAETAPAAQPAARAAPAESSPAPRPRRIGLLVGGLATWGASYAMSVMAALASLRSSNGVMCRTLRSD